MSCCPLFSTDATETPGINHPQPTSNIGQKFFPVPKPFKDPLSRRRVNPPPPPPLQCVSASSEVTEVQRAYRSLECRPWKRLQGAEAALANGGTTVPLSPEIWFSSGLGQGMYTIISHKSHAVCTPENAQPSCTPDPRPRLQPPTNRFHGHESFCRGFQHCLRAL